jgi:hypothetical protein
MIIESRAVEKAWQPTSQLGNEISALTALTSSFLISSSMLLLAWSQCSRSTAPVRVLVGCLGGAGSLLIYFDHGTRSVFALAVVPPACLALRRLAARSRATTLILGAIGAGALFLVLQFQMLYRAAWTRDSARESMLTEALTMQGSTDYFTEAVFATHLVPREHEFFRESVVLQFLIGPVPRFLWPDKPVFDMIWFYSNRRANVDIYQSGGNVLPGIVGQQYMSWGPLGVALEGLLVGLVAALISRRIESRPALFAGRSPEEAGDFMVLVWLAVSYRLLSPGFLYPVLLVSAQLALSRHLALEPPPDGG